MRGRREENIVKDGTSVTLEIMIVESDVGSLKRRSIHYYATSSLYERLMFVLEVALVVYTSAR
jgi:hypothetical protein